MPTKDLEGSLIREYLEMEKRDSISGKTSDYARLYLRFGARNYTGRGFCQRNGEYLQDIQERSKLLIQERIQVRNNVNLSNTLPPYWIKLDKQIKKILKSKRV